VGVVWEHLHDDAHNFCGRGDTSTAKKARTRGKIGQVFSSITVYNRLHCLEVITL